MVSCLGSRVQSCCGEAGALQTDIAGVCGEHSQWVCTRSRVCAFPVYTAQAPGCSIGSGPELLVVPVFRSSTKAQALLGLRSVPSPARAAQAARSLTGTLSPGVVHLLPSVVPASVSMCAGRVHLVSVLGSWSLAVTLLADVNHPESQEVFG